MSKIKKNVMERERKREILRDIDRDGKERKIEIEKKEERVRDRGKK